ncbi:GM13480 [Drosophila sechellia]|uniref:GM13480 n=1 Tax=Drosophila sechellia TaxID=7238 RepID=B4IEV9_DROSE|nr:GM13480 [Drosophila sechellia]
MYATPRPAPRQRLPPAGEPEDPYPDPDDEVPLRILRAAPQIPPKPLNILLDQRASICSELSTTSVQTSGKAGEDREESRYASNASLDCSESSHSGKFKSQSPGYVDAVDSSIPQSDHPDPNGHHPQAESSSAEQSSGSQDGDDDNNLLRSLGTTSKLLGEAIGERITFKAKGAKKRLDRNLKSSTEAISIIGADAGRSLKHASKRFGSNFSLGRNKDKTDIGIGGRPGGSGDMDLDRRQTMPNTDVFNTIQFSSSLNRNGGLPDLRENEAKLQKENYVRTDPDQEDDGCYEVPKTQGKPPSYDEALRSRPSPSDSPMSRNLAQEAAQLVQLRNQRQLSSSSSNGDESPRMPMPAFPPPRLSQQPEQFRMDALQPPVRQKRRKNYEHIELRRPPVDSAQLEELNRAAAAAEREESLLISAKNAEAETKTPKPERSDSWEFYGEDEDVEEDGDEEQEGSSSPEPVYANQEATYGKLFEMATAGSSRSNVWRSSSSWACITEDSELDACEGAVGGVPLPQALIEEFDPLSSKSSTLARSNKSNELLLLEHLLEEDTYGTVKAEQDDVSMCTSEEEPTTSAATSPKPQQPQIVHQNARLLSDSMENMLDSDQERAKPYLSRMPESTHKANGPVDLASASRNRTNWVRWCVSHPGVVEDILKEMQNRKAILRERQFQTFLDQEMKTPREMIPLDTITTLQCVSNSRVTDTATHFYCFEITTSQPKNGNGAGDTMSSNPNLLMTSSSSGNVKQQRVSHLYGVGKESERGVWMQRILESLTNSLPVKYTCHYYRAGWCYLKNSITSEWSGTWLVLRKSQRRLIFVSEANGNVEKMDLRKARCIVLKESDESIDNLHVESGPMLMIDCPPYAVYMIMSSARETKIWRHIIREVAHNNGFSLGDQQLTRYDVPVIVDKCINFVYIHGSMSEGIYRKSGSENSMHKLMSAFRADAFNVEITRNEYNEHDVANVLKRFMRDLPERLLGKLTDSFVFVTELAVATEKIPIYRELLARLSAIERETLRRIVGHLVFISSQQAKNKMSVQNLTMIWGPTLLAKKSDELIYSQKEADVLSDLVVLYKNLFPCSADEIKREQAMLACLQKYYAAAETLKDAVKQSGDIKIWISLNPNPENKTEEKTQVNATISPTKTAYELCREYSAKMQLPTHQLTLYEVILNDSLERPLHHDTKVFDVILNWSYWPEEDRKHNYLVVRPVEMLCEIQRAVKNLATVTPGKELRFADSRTKTFKTLQCELRDGKIVVSKKDKNDKTTIVREIFLQSSTAYLGCERKRDFPWSWAITFVERTQAQIMRSRDAPFIGHVLAGSEWMDRTIWYSSIWYCLYRDNILPPAEIIIK